jgi:hypothetical protein
VLTPDDWDQWARSPATEAYVWRLEETIRDTQERWAQGHFRGATVEESTRLTEQALAGVEVLRQAIDRIEEMKITQQLENEA